MEKREELIRLIKGKKVFLACHWDADGITSGALIYHMIKPHVSKIETISKGETFLINKEDIKGEPDVIICTDIKPGNIDHKKTIYIDHHPWDNGKVEKDDYLYCIFNHEMQSCSLLIWQELLFDTEDPYFIFLTLIGYFGDGGNREEIPLELQMKANKYLRHETSFGEHNLMQKKASRFSDGYYLEIEKYVSALNTGKRMHWNGDIPFELFKNISSYKPFIYNMHPIAEQLNDYKMQLRNYYNMELKVFDKEKIQYAMIECDKNVQGVLCARYLKEKPIIILNKYKGNIIASMRVPDHLNFDAGEFLSGFNDKIPSLVGGGHEKAAGATLKEEDLDKFLDLLNHN